METLNITHCEVPFELFERWAIVTSGAECLVGNRTGNVRVKVDKQLIVNAYAFTTTNDSRSVELNFTQSALLFEVIENKVQELTTVARTQKRGTASFYIGYDTFQGRYTANIDLVDIEAYEIVGNSKIEALLTAYVQILELQLTKERK